MQTNHGLITGSDGSGFWGFARYKMADSPFGFLVRYDSWDAENTFLLTFYWRW